MSESTAVRRSLLRPEAHEPVNEQLPLPRRVAARAVLRCAVTTIGLLLRRRTHLPREHVGLRLRFGDGTSAPVYRETTVDHGVIAHPCVLVVAFRLRHVHGWAHRLFRWESLLNTPLFVGFPGLVSKLWMAHDDHETYRGVYEWDGEDRAEYYARCLWRVLALVSESESIRYMVLPGVRRQDVIEGAREVQDRRDEDADWWRVVRAA